MDSKKVSQEDPELVEKLYNEMESICQGFSPRVIFDSGQCAMVKLLKKVGADKIDAETLEKIKELRGKDER